MGVTPKRGEQDAFLRAMKGAIRQPKLGHCAIGKEGEPDLPEAREPIPPGLTWKQRVDIMAERVAAGLSATHPDDSSVFDASAGLPQNKLRPKNVEYERPVFIIPAAATSRPSNSGNY